MTRETILLGELEPIAVSESGALTTTLIGVFLEETVAAAGAVQTVEASFSGAGGLVAGVTQVGGAVTTPIAAGFAGAGALITVPILRTGVAVSYTGTGALSAVPVSYGSLATALAGTGSLAGATDAAGTGDPYFANVTLLCHFDGANSATTFVDSSKFNRTVTGTGGSQLTTGQARFGVSSLQASAGAGYAASPDSLDWRFTGQFTVELWVRPTSTPSGLRALAAQWSSGVGNLSWWFGFNGNALEFHWSSAGTDNSPFLGAYIPTLNNWVHIAADRDASNVIRLYASGVVVANSVVSSASYDSNEALKIGNDGSGVRPFIGQIDEVRITKGVGRYGGAFTPPTAPFPDAPAYVPITAILFAGEGALSTDVALAGGAVYVPIAAALSGIGSLAGGIAARVQIAAQMAGAGFVAADVLPVVAGLLPIAAAFAGAGSLSALARTVSTIAAAFTGYGDLRGPLGRRQDIVSALAGLGSLNAATGILRTLESALTGIGALNVTAFDLRPGAGALYGDGLLRADARGILDTLARLDGEGALDAADRLDAAVQIALSGAGALVASYALVQAIEAALFGDSALWVELGLKALDIGEPPRMIAVPPNYRELVSGSPARVVLPFPASRIIRTNGNGAPASPRTVMVGTKRRILVS